MGNLGTGIQGAMYDCWTHLHRYTLVQSITQNASPVGLTADDQGNIYVPDNLGNRLLKVSNGFTTTSSGYTVLNTSQAVNGPNSLSFTNGYLLGVNSMDGNIFQVACEWSLSPFQTEYEFYAFKTLKSAAWLQARYSRIQACCASAVDSGRNGGITILTQVVPNSQGTNGGGVNFNAIYSVDSSAGAAVNSIWFQNGEHGSSWMCEPRLTVLLLLEP